MKAVALVVSVSLLLWGCDRRGIAEPGVEIRVERQGQDYVFAFETCKGQKIGVTWIHLTEGPSVSEGREVPPHCMVYAPTTTPGLKGDWRYGSTPPGFVMKSCEPLARNKAYEVQVTGAGGGQRVFFVRDDGSVELREGSCGAPKSM